MSQGSGVVMGLLPLIDGSRVIPVHHQHKVSGPPERPKAVASATGLRLKEEVARFEEKAAELRDSIEMDPARTGVELAQCRLELAEEVLEGLEGKLVAVRREGEEADRRLREIAARANRLEALREEADATIFTVESELKEAQLRLEKAIHARKRQLRVTEVRLEKLRGRLQRQLSGMMEEVPPCDE